MSPGPLATYVRLCPRISPSSRTPPSAIRWNGRSSALAIDCPSEVLPVPGGPTNLSKSKFEGAYRNQFSHNQKCGEKMDIQQYGSLDAPPDAPSHNRLRGRLGVHVRVIPHERLGRRLGLQLLRRPARLDGEPRLRFCLCLARAFGGLLLSGLHLAQPHDGEVLDEPPLDAVESEVIRVELALRDGLESDPELAADLLPRRAPAVAPAESGEPGNDTTPEPFDAGALALLTEVDPRDSGLVTDGSPDRTTALERHPVPAREQSAAPVTEPMKAAVPAAAAAPPLNS